jgi:hypothetical protein
MSEEVLNELKMEEVKLVAGALAIVPGKVSKWIGLDLSTCTFDRVKWLATTLILPEEILDTPSGHLTLLFGVTGDGWATAHRMISDAALCAADIVFESTPRLVEPSHVADKSYWCLHVDVAASPKLVALADELRKRVDTPDERADHAVQLHMTCLIVKRSIRDPVAP